MEGGEPAPSIMRPRNLSLAELKDCRADHIIDIREPMAYASGHLSGSMSLPVGMIPAFAGWFISEGERIALVAADESQLATAMEHLVRIALDNVAGGYVGVVSAAKQGEHMQQTPMIGSDEVKNRLDTEKQNWKLLDVRDAEERSSDAIDKSQHIYVGELNERWQALDKHCHYTLMCASGARATVAAGWLVSKGFSDIDIYLGGMEAWNNA